MKESVTVVRWLAFVGCLGLAFGVSLDAQKVTARQPYQDTSLTQDQRVHDLVSRMTLEE
jgi:hypothetical protein